MAQGGDSAGETGSLLGALSGAWAELAPSKRAILCAADPPVMRAALETAVAVASTLCAGDVTGRPVCTRRAEKDVLEQAARELQLLVLHSASSPHALDGQIPMSIEGGTGRIGIEVKSGATTISTEEVDKFRADLFLGPFVIGIFVSVRAPIAKIPRGVHVQREVALAGAVPTIYVSPVSSEATMTQLTRNALTLARLLAQQRPGRFAMGAAPVALHDRLVDLETMGQRAHAEVATLGVVRKRLREEEEQARRRMDRAVDALLGVQQRLSATVDSGFTACLEGAALEGEAA